MTHRPPDQSDEHADLWAQWHGFTACPVQSRLAAVSSALCSANAAFCNGPFVVKRRFVNGKGREMILTFAGSIRCGAHRRHRSGAESVYCYHFFGVTFCPACAVGASPPGSGFRSRSVQRPSTLYLVRAGSQVPLSRQRARPRRVRLPSSVRASLGTASRSGTLLGRRFQALPFAPCVGVAFFSFLRSFFSSGAQRHSLVADGTEVGVVHPHSVQDHADPPGQSNLHFFPAATFLRELQRPGFQPVLTPAVQHDIRRLIKRSAQTDIPGLGNRSHDRSFSGLVAFRRQSDPRTYVLRSAEPGGIIDRSLVSQRHDWPNARCPAAHACMRERGHGHQRAAHRILPGHAAHQSLKPGQCLAQFRSRFQDRCCHCLKH